MTKAQAPKPAPADWHPDWRGQTAVVLASGPSAAAADLSAMAGARVIAVNTSWRLWPQADVLYACDRAWWTLHKGVPDFSGVKVTHDLHAARHYGLQRVAIAMGRHEILTKPAGLIGHGGNGGFQALNLAIQFGAKRIVLVGIDCHAEGGLHWHANHPAPLNNPRPDTLKAWIQRFDAVAPQLAALGVTVLNASPASALTAYAKVDLAAALQQRRAA